MVTYGHIWSPFPKASKVVCQFMPLLQTSSGHHRAQPAQKRAGRKSVERSGIHSRFELWNSAYDSFFWCFIVLVFFYWQVSSGLHIALLCHIVTVRLQAFWDIFGSSHHHFPHFFPVWSQFLEPKKSLFHRAAGAKSRSREVAGSASTSHPRYAYTCVMWGTNPGYALGAAVLGARLKDWTGCFGRWRYGCRGIDR